MPSDSLLHNEEKRQFSLLKRESVEVPITAVFISLTKILVAHLSLLVLLVNLILYFQRFKRGQCSK